MRKDTRPLAERFAAFDAAHPEIYTAFKRAAFQLRQHRDHYSARLILDGLSFHSALDGRDMDHYKINHDYTRLYALKLMTEYPSFKGFFETRKPSQQRGIAA